MIRLAHVEDLHNITKIYNDAILNTTAVYSYDPVTLENRQAWFAQKLAKNEPVLVYVKDNEVVGFATYGSFRDWPAYKNTVEHSIYVDPKTRKEGIASKLLTELIKEVDYRGYKIIVAGIDASNEGSIRLHKKFNFVACGTIKSVGYKFDKWLDLAFYQLILK